jgi:hypothetical protein
VLLFFVSEPIYISLVHSKHEPPSMATANEQTGVSPSDNIDSKDFNYSHHG